MTAEPLKQIVFDLDAFDACPCCGSKVDVKMIGGLYKIQHKFAACTTDLAEITIYCPNCGLQSKPFEFSPEGISLAITAWNRREPIGNSDELPSIIDMRIEELEEMIECNTMYRAHDLVLHEIATLKWVLSLKKEDK